MTHHHIASWLILATFLLGLPLAILAVLMAWRGWSVQPRKV